MFWHRSQIKPIIAEQVALGSLNSLEVFVSCFQECRRGMTLNQRVRSSILRSECSTLVRREESNDPRFMHFKSSCSSHRGPDHGLVKGFGNLSWRIETVEWNLLRVRSTMCLTMLPLSRNRVSSPSRYFYAQLLPCSSPFSTNALSNRLAKFLPYESRSIRSSSISMLNSAQPVEAGVFVLSVRAVHGLETTAAIWATSS
jgi:hypothetical protein